MKIIFVTGGVISSLGKGLATASIANLMQEHGEKVMVMKLDPYLNFDSGTMNPQQHGEVYVTEDGLETDLDLGHYERFLHDTTLGANSSITSGKIYHELLENERKGKYLGKTVQVIPHVTDLIKEKILKNAVNADFLLCEIGGTIGDIEALPFLEAIRQLRYELGEKSTLFIHLTLVPFIESAGELKTKPSQRSVKELLSLGIQPDILLCRAQQKLPSDIQKKLAQFCNVREDAVFSAVDVQNIYEIPILYHQNQLDKKIFDHFQIENHKEISLTHWHDYHLNLMNPTAKVRIAIIGKYANAKESYKSLLEALQHAAVTQKIALEIAWFDAKESTNVAKNLREFDGIIIPGGFGIGGIEEKISVAKFARENHVPILGICLGMQVMAVEFARNVLQIEDAGAEEFGDFKNKIIESIRKHIAEIDAASADVKSFQNKMRLGSFEFVLKSESLAKSIYNSDIAKERHRHRHGLNPKYVEIFEQNGMIISGKYVDNGLPTIVEYQHHPWFLGAQFHPEFKSRPYNPHPIFNSFVQNVLKNKYDNNVGNIEKKLVLN